MAPTQRVSEIAIASESYLNSATPKDPDTSRCLGLMPLDGGKGAIDSLQFVPFSDNFFLALGISFEGFAATKIMITVDSFI